MVIKIARYAGFCQGVKRAIDTALDVGEKYNNAVTLGPIVHNQFVVDYLANHGVGVINSTDDFNEIESDTAVVLRSHGIAKSVYDVLDEKNVQYIDATCPFVKAVHKLAHKAHNEEKHIIIVGDPKHPEVIGIKGWTDDQGYIVNTIQDIEDLPELSGEIVVVAQTTQTGENWQQITDRLRKMYPRIKTYNTICKATSERQTSAIELAREVDVMLVVGSFSSSNTKKLTQVCQEQGAITYQIESSDDLKKEWFKKSMRIGITAGASTPDWVLKEVVQMVEEMQGTVDEMKVLVKGDILKATVTQVEDNQVTVDIGYKYDGIVPIGEISSLHIETAHDALKVGDEIQVEVLKINDEKGKMILSKKSVDSKNAWQDLKQKFENNETIEVVVADVVKGGLVVDIGVRGFIPASHVERHFVEDFSDYKGRTLKVKIIEFDPENNKVILSQKHVLDEEVGNLKLDTLNTIKVGSIIEGTVQRLTDFGAFVDVGGIDGLVHVSELAWQRVDKPADVVKEGDKVKVKVLNVDAQNGRVSLSLKSALPSPWDQAEKELKQGDVTEGIVKRLVSFGAFVELLLGVEGLVHISEISDRHIGTPSDVLEVGQKVSVKILEVSVQDKRISLSIRQTLEPTPVPEKVSVEFSKDNELNTYTLGEMIGDKLKNFKN